MRALLLAVGLIFVAAPLTGSVRAATGDIGYEGSSFSGTGTPTGTKRAESVLWWNDGSWWADMWDTASQDFHIFRLDTATQTWLDTGVPIDTRSNTHADVLWDGTHLYVASHLFVSDESPAASGYPSYLFRFSYDPVTRTYSLDSGFPATINNYRTETLVIDKDSAGKLWATWQQGNQIYVNRTVGDDRTWGTPFVLPVSGTSVTVDDNSSVVAFGGNKIGVMWSNQSTSSTAMYFAVHVDGQPDTAWEPSRTAIQGSGSADDHINLKSLQADGSGRVFAAVKTEFSTSSAPLIMLLVRDPATGDWSSHAISRVSDCPNRPLVVIDEENRIVRAFFTAPGPPSYSCNSSGGAIYEKTSPTEAISFPVGSGTAVIQDADSPFVHNVSSSKQNVNSTTGIALLAINGSTSRYWHQFTPIAPSGPPTPPTADFSGTPTSGTAPLGVTFTDLSSGSPTSWSWSFGDGGTSTERNPSHTYAAAGVYTVSVTVSNATGSDTKTQPDYVNVSAAPVPTAEFTGTPTSGATPLTVTFTDLSTGSATAWSWDFGDGGTSTQQNASHTYTSAGTYTVSLAVSNSTGADTETKVDYVSVSPLPPSFSLAVSPSGQTVVRGNGTTYTVAVTPSNGFTGPVDLTASGLPAGASASFDPNPLTVATADSSNSTLSVLTSATTKPGNYSLTISAVSGTITRTTTVTLQVKRK